MNSRARLAQASLSSAEVSFALGRVGSLEAGERVKESARGTLGKGNAFPSSCRPKRTFFFPIHLPHPLGASAEERAQALRVEENFHATLIRANSRQLSTSFDPCCRLNLTACCK